MHAPAKAPPEGALGTYETFAPFYDAFTSDYPYDEWLGDLEAWARHSGLSGRRLLDVACGTGNSFLPLLARGYEVVGCDLSPSMVVRARAKAAGRARVEVADMRALPWRGRFDLVTCVDDSLNYLISDADLVASLRSMARALAPGGRVVFDTNSRITHQTSYSSDIRLDADRNRFSWRGEASGPDEVGEIGAATVELLVPGAEPVFAGRHVQRHYPIATVRAACAEACLELLGVRGSLPVGLDPEPDEDRHQKIAFLAARPQTREGVL
jgi:SAM-dependent methyltransferase